jgi:NADPH:quinone reductase-like Zn-dependent oxidoreductase
MDEHGRMRAVVPYQPGGPEVMRPQVLDAPRIGSDEALVHLESAEVDPVEPAIVPIPAGLD